MRYHNITKDDMLNGDGLRVVLWLAGCDHCCRDCHNPLTWDPEGGLLFDRAAKEELFAALDKSYIAGLTLSGGDPLHPANRLGARQLVREVRERFCQKTVWLYTGYLWEEIWQLPIMQYVDVCVDGEFERDKKDARLLWKGSKNQRVINVPATLAQKNPLLPLLHCSDYGENDEEALSPLTGHNVWDSCALADRGRAACEG